MVLRHVYRAGEKAFVDYAGPTVEVTDRRTGEIREAKVFVGVLAASNHTFADVTLTRSLPDWTASHVRMFEYWGGMPELVIPDNEKAAVRRASRYEPDVNRTHHDLATHYGTAVLPARPRSPQDKAKVEAAVQNVGRWVLAPLRNHRFFSLSEVREAVKPLVAALNERPFQKAEGSRHSLFEDLDRPALKPLPAERYAFRTHSGARRSRSGSAPRRSRSFTGTGAWRPTSADAGREATQPFGRICPPRTAPTSSGPRRDSSAGPARPGPRPLPSQGSCSIAGPIRNRATAAALASCGSRAPTPPNAWKPPAAARWTTEC